LGEAGRDDYYGYGLIQTRKAFDVLNATLSGDRELQGFPDGVDGGFFLDGLFGDALRFILFPIVALFRFLFF